MRTLIAILAVAAVVACAAADTPFRWPLGEDAVWTLNDHHLRDDIPSGNFTLTRYHNYTEIKELFEYYNSYCTLDISRVSPYGVTSTGEELLMFRLTDNPTTNEIDEPEVMILAGGSGSEPYTKEAAIAFIDYLCTGYINNDVTVTGYIESIDFLIVAAYNPDAIGSVGDGTGDAIANFENDAGQSVYTDFPDATNDPDRDLGDMSDEGFNLLQLLDFYPFTLLVELRSGLAAPYLLYPYYGAASATDRQTVGDQATFAQIGAGATGATGGLAGIQVTNAASVLPAFGTVVDYAFDYNGIMGVTLNTNTDAAPDASTFATGFAEVTNTLVGLSLESLKGMRGQVVDPDVANGVPVRGSVLRFQGNDPPQPVLSESNGAYHRILPPGTYTFNIETPDYPDVEGVTVTVGNGDAVVVPNQEIIRNTQPPFITLTEEPGLGGSGVGLIIIFAVVFVLLVVAAVGFWAYKTDKFRYRQNVTNDVVGNDFDDVDTVPTDGVPMDAEKADLEVASRDAPAVPDDEPVV